MPAITTSAAVTGGLVRCLPDEQACRGHRMSAAAKWPQSNTCRLDPTVSTSLPANTSHHPLCNVNRWR